MPDFITKDSGEREEYDSGMRRDTQAGKPDFSLITPLDVPFDQQMLTRWAALMARGAEKYGERNWELATSEKELARFKSSAFRHFCQWLMGDSPEEDHAAAVFFNITAAERIWYFGVDSKPNPKPNHKKLHTEEGYGPLGIVQRCHNCAGAIQPTDSAAYTAVVGQTPVYYHGGCWESPR